MSLQDATTPSCCGELVPVVVGGEVEPVTALRTETWRAGVTIEQLDALLDPALWPTKADFWCDMGEEPGPREGVRRFVEVVSSDCKGSARLVTRLDFCRRDFPDGRVALDYWLCDDQSHPADRLVVVDEGSIVVRETEVGGERGVRVTTTKRIRFVEPMDGAHLAMTACAFGWDGAGDQFIFGVEAIPTA